MFIILDPELLEWEMTSNSYNIGNDITYKDRRYYINTPGYYEVQCRLQFDTYSNIDPDKDLAIVHVVFSVIRSTRSLDNRNLMSERSTLEPKEYRGIQLGPTVFRLEANDSVYVSVNKHQFVYPTRDNYFAIRKIEWLKFFTYWHQKKQHNENSDHEPPWTSHAQSLACWSYFGT